MYIHSFLKMEAFYLSFISLLIHRSTSRATWHALSDVFITVADKQSGLVNVASWLL